MSQALQVVIAALDAGVVNNLDVEGDTMLHWHPLHRPGHGRVDPVHVVGEHPAAHLGEEHRRCGRCACLSCADGLQRRHQEGSLVGAVKHQLRDAAPRVGVASGVSNADRRIVCLGYRYRLAVGSGKRPPDPLACAGVLDALGVRHVCVLLHTDAKQRRDLVAALFGKRLVLVVELLELLGSGLDVAVLGAPEEAVLGLELADHLRLDFLHAVDLVVARLATGCGFRKDRSRHQVVSVRSACGAGDGASGALRAVIEVAGDSLLRDGGGAGELKEVELGRRLDSRPNAPRFAVKRARLSDDVFDGEGLLLVGKRRFHCSDILLLLSSAASKHRGQLGMELSH
mmetsp:Transcript_38761/g.58221  ORF Transcript_38761/g.58221 Transcript_38761/m.58221 type:complete len:342 (-) Transcript_38761:205-1230(-)